MHIEFYFVVTLFPIHIEGVLLLTLLYSLSPSLSLHQSLPCLMLAAFNPFDNLQLTCL